MRVRPSDVVSVQDEYAAFCLDEAVMYFGSFVKQKLQEVKGKNEAEIEGKQKLILKKLLEAEGAEGRFATPVATR